MVFAYSDVPHEQVMHLASPLHRGGRRLPPARRAAHDAAQHAGPSSPSPPCAPASARARPPATSPGCCTTGACASSRSATPCPTATSPRRPCQRFATYADLDRHECTIEEREEYEPHIDSGLRRLRRRRLRADPARGREGGRRHPLGRRQQRPAVLRARPAHRARRPAAARRRGGLPPRRGERPDGRRRPHRQVRLGADRRHRGRRGSVRRAQPARRRSCAPTARSPSTTRAWCRAGGSSSSRTARR